MPPSDVTSLRDYLGATPHCLNHFLWSPTSSIALGELVHGSTLGDKLPMLSGRSVLITTRDQLTTTLTLIELDGVVRRLTLCPPDLRYEYLPSLIAKADIDAIVSDNDMEHHGLGIPLLVKCALEIGPRVEIRLDRTPTEWVLLTSGTTGLPKMVVHSLASLTAAIKTSKTESPPVWGTFYDIRRYGGLQILFRTILGGGSFVLSSVAELLGQYLVRLGANRATHILGTPSHWRRALMSPAARVISPQYVRLSGEIADQAILDSLRLFYPQARIAHAFASTEAGVAFEVDDGFEGFPAKIVGPRSGNVELKVDDLSLRVRSPGTASGYVGREDSVLADDEGFVDTGDIVELRGNRYYFLGRRGGVINVGGFKIHPEEVEVVINRHPAVQMSSVRSRKNPITGSIVVADVVLKAEYCSGTNVSSAGVKEEILRICRDLLPQHKVPALLNFVPDLDLGAAGKLARHA